jgi:hypothetical protein
VKQGMLSYVVDQMSEKKANNLLCNLELVDLRKIQDIASIPG